MFAWMLKKNNYLLKKGDITSPFSLTSFLITPN